MTKKRQKIAAPAAEPSASANIDARIAQLGDWRGAVLARVRALVHEAVPDVDWLAGLLEGQLAELIG